MTLVFKANHPDDLRNEIIRYLTDRKSDAQYQLARAMKAHERATCTARVFLLDDLIKNLNGAVIDDSL